MISCCFENLIIQDDSFSVIIYITNDCKKINNIDYLLKQIMKYKIDKIIFALNKDSYKILYKIIEKYNCNYVFLKNNYSGSADALQLAKPFIEEKNIFIDANKCCFYIEKIMETIFSNNNFTNILFGNSLSNSFFHNFEIKKANLLYTKNNNLTYLEKRNININHIEIKNILIANNICMLNNELILIIIKYLESKILQNIMHFDKIDSCIYDVLNYLVINNIVKIKVFKEK